MIFCVAYFNGFVLEYYSVENANIGVFSELCKKFGIYLQNIYLCTRKVLTDKRKGINHECKEELPL